MHISDITATSVCQMRSPDVQLRSKVSSPSIRQSKTHLEDEWEKEHATKDYLFLIMGKKAERASRCWRQVGTRNDDEMWCLDQLTVNWCGKHYLCGLPEAIQVSFTQPSSHQPNPDKKSGNKRIQQNELAPVMSGASNEYFLVFWRKFCHYFVSQDVKLTLTKTHTPWIWAKT